MDCMTALLRVRKSRHCGGGGGAAAQVLKSEKVELISTR
jgi:hypothetical protein